MKAIITTVITVVIIAAILGFAIYYIVRSKKQGRKCIGCPDSASCPSAKNGCCSCGYGGDNK
ncbi:MAG: FeoB-associated Cys-rich membrane protein [Clostridia bacterium]|nr:FeoB-associated Cys-rich membrane protein [Clostridia bacterium]